MYRWLKYLQEIKVQQSSDSRRTGNWGNVWLSDFCDKRKDCVLFVKTGGMVFVRLTLLLGMDLLWFLWKCVRVICRLLFQVTIPISAKKKLALSKACKAYMKALRNLPEIFRFDIVEVGFDSERKVKINHYENVTLFEKDYRPQYVR